MNYYNEFDQKAAAWLRELIKNGHIPAGDVDERSITEVKPDDLTKYTQCHFFAGIGGWAYALRLAGWPEDKPVWTGSCPCQPFSNAGRGDGVLDPRHLWPAWFPLVRECTPPVVFGEQVASKSALEWLDGVFSDLEGEDYACAAADLCAAGVGAPHIRQRMFWVANSTTERFSVGHSKLQRDSGEAESYGVQMGNVANTQSEERNRVVPECAGNQCERARTGSSSTTGGLGNADGQGSEGQPFGLLGAGSEGHWSRFYLLPCLDGKARRVEPGTFPLAHGIPSRVGLLRGYGNAIVPEVAARFVRACFPQRGGLLNV